MLAIAGGGALGAVFRFWCASAIYAWLGRGFPYGTLAVNIFGSFLMGMLFVLLLERVTVSIEVRSALLVGFLGAFTTFSTFALETLTLIEEGASVKALANILASVVACIVAAYLGIALGRQW